ncbi:MAG: sulfurtransferase [Prochloraceae cyanobacterium]
MSEIKYIVSPSWLEKSLANPEIVIVDCRFQLSDPNWGYQQYKRSHIPGAYYLNLDRDLSAPLQKHGGRHPLPDPQTFAAKLEQIGVVKDETLVIAYDDSRFAFAARLWWLLRYFGHDRVALLDGGWNGWLERGFSVSQDLAIPKIGNFLPQLRLNYIVTRERVKIARELPDIFLVDARDNDRYRGEREPIDPIAGHITGAINSPWKQVSNSQGYLQPLHFQQQLWADLKGAEEIIVYCGSGVTACVNLLSLELAGISDFKLYPGGWSDWCSYLEL